MAMEGNLYDFGRELLAVLSFRCTGTPAIGVGESVAEARNAEPGGYEQGLSPGVFGGWAMDQRASAGVPLRSH